MARRRTKKRTHVGATSGSAANVAKNVVSREPRSMVIRIGAGEVGPSVSQLVKDIRTMMEPGTASRLKERRSNRLRDYTAMAGPLGVSHLLLVSRSTNGNTNLRLALTPRGPTLHFQIEQYSLSKDVHKAQKHPHGGGREYLTAPLLVMNNFSTPPPADGSQSHVPTHLESLTTSVFQSLFPPISAAATPLSSIRRVLLLNRETSKGSSGLKRDDEGSYILNLRHYSITTKRTGLSRGIKRLQAAERLMGQRSVNNRNLPNLGKLEDVADYFLDPSTTGNGYSSASDSEFESDAGIEVQESVPKKISTKNVVNNGRTNSLKVSNSSLSGVEKRAVKLYELGPRMRLRMTKVEEGVCNGKVMWHEYLSKTDEEVKKMEDVWNKRRREKEERKRIQKENVKRKTEDKKGIDSNEKDQDHAEGTQDGDLGELEDEWDSEGLEDDD